MEHYDIDEIKSNVEVMSLREKIEYLQDIQDDIMNEIDELESVKNKVDELLDYAEMDLCKKIDSEIEAALKDVIAAHSGDDRTSSIGRSMDIEGLRFWFGYRPHLGVNQLSIGISGRKHIIRTGDFNAEFGNIVKQLFPEAKYRNMLFDFNLATEADLIPLVKEIAEKLLSINQKIEDLARKYGVWG